MLQNLRSQMRVRPYMAQCRKNILPANVNKVYDLLLPTRHTLEGILLVGFATNSSQCAMNQFIFFGAPSRFHILSRQGMLYNQEITQARFLIPPACGRIP